MLQVPAQTAVAHAVSAFEAAPLQSSPPCCGGGLVHVRRWVRVPVRPHAVTEHASSAPHADQPPWIGHGAVEHGVVLVAEPLHSLPRNCGAGLVHVRRRVRVPVWPQPLTEHAS